MDIKSIGIAIAMLLLGGALTMLREKYWKSRDHAVQKEEKKDDLALDDARAERRDTATALATLTKDTAERVETDRRERSDRTERGHDDVVRRVEAIEKTLVELTVKLSPFWAAVQSKIVKDLTHPSPQFHEMDDLLRQLEALEIDAKGRARLSALLDERIASTDPEVTEDERESAKLMRGVMAKVIGEAQGEASGQRQ